MLKECYSPVKIVLINGASVLPRLKVARRVEKAQLSQNPTRLLLVITLLSFTLYGASLFARVGERIEAGQVQIVYSVAFQPEAGAPSSAEDKVTPTAVPGLMLRAERRVAIAENK